MAGVGDFLTRTRGRGRLDWSDIFTYVYLTLGTIVMFLPVLWLVFSLSLIHISEPTRPY